MRTGFYFQKPPAQPQWDLPVIGLCLGILANLAVLIQFADWATRRH